jgi:hypothetical protein
LIGTRAQEVAITLDLFVRHFHVSSAEHNPKRLKSQRLKLRKAKF